MFNSQVSYLSLALGGRQEFELTIPRWRDDPSYLLQVMKTYLESDFDLEDKLRHTEDCRFSDTESLLNDLPFLVKLKMRTLIKLYSITAESRGGNTSDLYC